MRPDGPTGDMERIGRPVPVPDDRSRGFWEAAAAHALVVRCCDECGWLSYPPDIVCSRCLSLGRSFHWHGVSGRGTLRSWTVVRTAFLPGFKPCVPYVVAAAELDEQPGLRLTARLLDDPEAPLRLGARTETDFEDTGEGGAVPVLRLAPA